VASLSQPICVGSTGGTGIHLFSFDLPAVETAIAVSVITLAMLVMPNKPNWLCVNSAIAGLFFSTPTVSQLLAQE